jgi:predicted enzyme related to lactoylglutathione lyase
MGEGPKSFVLVADIDAVPARVENLGGRIVMPKTDIGGVGPVAVFLDTENNPLGLWARAALR